MKTVLSRNWGVILMLKSSCIHLSLAVLRAWLPYPYEKTGF